MVSENPTRRERYSPDAVAEQAAAAAKATQQEHIDAIAALAGLPGVDIDAFTEFYGEDVMDSTDPNHVRTVKRWSKLLHAIGEGTALLGLIDTTRTLRPGCYGLGATPRYFPSSRLGIFRNDRPLRVSFTPMNDDAREASLVGSGVTYGRSYRDEAIIEHGSDVAFTLDIKGTYRYSVKLPEIYSADTVRELAHDINRHHDPYYGYDSVDDSAVMYSLFQDKALKQHIDEL